MTSSSAWLTCPWAMQRPDGEHDHDWRLGKPNYGNVNGELVSQWLCPCGAEKLEPIRRVKP